MGAVGCWSEGWAAATGPNGHMAAGRTLFWGVRGHITGRQFGETSDSFIQLFRGMTTDVRNGVPPRRPTRQPEAYAIVGSSLGILVNSFPIVRIVA